MLRRKFIIAAFNMFLFIEIGFCQQLKVINSPQKNLKIAIRLIEINEEDSALQYLNACLSRRFDDRVALSLRARIYSNRNFFVKALTDYNALIAINPENKEVFYSRGIILYQLSRFALALNDFQIALKLPSGETQSAFFKVDDATNFASGISTINGMDANLWNYIGLCYHAMDRFEQAIKSYDNGIKINEKSIDLYINRALTFEESGQYDRAISDYEIVLSTLPDHAIATFNLLNIQKKHNGASSHLASLDSFVEENPSLPYGYEARGLFYFESNDFESALPDFENAVKIDPVNIEYLFNLALCNEKLKKTDQAEELFLVVIKLDPGHSGAYFNLGNLQFIQGLFDEAISYFTIAHQLNSKNAFILYNRALAYFEINLLEKACQDMKEVKKIDDSLADGFYIEYCSTAE